MIWELATGLLILIMAVGALAAFSRHKKSHTSDLPLTGKRARVEKQLDPYGAVLVQGELWLARSRNDQVLTPGLTVHIVGTQGHLLIVDQDQ